MPRQEREARRVRNYRNMPTGADFAGASAGATWARGACCCHAAGSPIRHHAAMPRRQLVPPAAFAHASQRRPAVGVRRRRVRARRFTRRKAVKARSWRCAAPPALGGSAFQAARRIVAFSRCMWRVLQARGAFFAYSRHFVCSPCAICFKNAFSAHRNAARQRLRAC